MPNEPSWNPGFVRGAASPLPLTRCSVAKPFAAALVANHFVHRDRLVIFDPSLSDLRNVFSRFMRWDLTERKPKAEPRSNLHILISCLTSLTIQSTPFNNKETRLKLFCLCAHPSPLDTQYLVVNEVRRTGLRD
jgi:hypothetical protein